MAQVYSPMHQAGGGSPTATQSMEQILAASAESEKVSAIFSVFPRSESMDCVNDPRFMGNSVIAKRLAAFQTISVVSVIMVNLSKATMFALEKDIDIDKPFGWVQYAGFVIMMLVFLANLTTVVVVVQQMFMTYRLLTAGPTGFEIAKSYYLNPNIITMRHMAIKLFFFSLPLFVAGSSCMVIVNFGRAGGLTGKLAYPAVAFLLLTSLLLLWVSGKQQSIFRERYYMAKAHEQPLLNHVEGMSTRSATRNGGFFSGLDV